MGKAIGQVVLAAKPPQYQIVRGASADELEGYVRAAMDEGGWVPLGGAAVSIVIETSDRWYELWAQAMTRSEQ